MTKRYDADRDAALKELRARVGTPPPPKPKRRDIWFGATGDEVRLLQNRLGAHGVYSGAHGDEPGIFGPATERALRAFQSANQLRPDAICGQRTWAAVEEPGRYEGS